MVCGEEISDCSKPVRSLWNTFLFFSDRLICCWFVSISKNDVLPWAMEYDQRQLLAQFRSTSKSEISSGAFLVALQKTMIYVFPNTERFCLWHNEFEFLVLEKNSTVARVKPFYVACSNDGFLRWTMENDQRQLLAQSRSSSKSGVSSGAFLFVLQKTMIYAFPPTHFFPRTSCAPPPTHSRCSLASRFLSLQSTGFPHVFLRALARVLHGHILRAVRPRRD